MDDDDSQSSSGYGFLTAEQMMLGALLFMSMAHGFDGDDALTVPRATATEVIQQQRRWLANADVVISPEDFPRDDDRDYWIAAHTIVARDMEVNWNTLAAEVKSMGVWEKHGGPEYLSFLVSKATFDKSSGEYWIKQIKEASVERQAVAAGYEYIEVVHSGEGPLADRLAQGEQIIITKTRLDLGGQQKSVGERIDELLERLYRNELAGIETGLFELDQRLTAGGLSRRSLNILAAATSVGKTSLACEIFLRAQRHDKQRARALYLSVEMGEDEIWQRLIANLGEVDWSEIHGRRAEPTELERRRILSARNSITAMPVDVTFHRRLTPAAVRRSARAMETRHDGIDLIVVDYLQLMDPDEPYSKQSRTLEIASITKELKNIANEFNAPVLLLSQLNREAVRGDQTEPELFNLRDSGAIEQDADLVIFLWESKLKPNTYGLPGNHRTPDLEIEWKIAKQRNGPKVKLTPLHFRARYTKFVDSSH